MDDLSSPQGMMDFEASGNLWATDWLDAPSAIIKNGADPTLSQLMIEDDRLTRYDLSLGFDSFQPPHGTSTELWALPINNINGNAFPQLPVIDFTDPRWDPPRDHPYVQPVPIPVPDLTNIGAYLRPLTLLPDPDDELRKEVEDILIATFPMSNIEVLSDGANEIFEPWHGFSKAEYEYIHSTKFSYKIREFSESEAAEGQPLRDEQIASQALQWISYADCGIEDEHHTSFESSWGKHFMDDTEALGPDVAASPDNAAAQEAFSRSEQPATVQASEPQSLPDLNLPPIPYLTQAELQAIENILNDPDYVFETVGNTVD
ncbi:MAG: hypothetical protein Q9218_000238 [Villophora microphyllina]